MLNQKKIQKKEKKYIANKIQEYLGLSVSNIPDPWGEEESYARAFQKPFENASKILGVEPEFIYQHRMYKSGKYLTDICECLQKKKPIKKCAGPI